MTEQTYTVDGTAYPTMWAALAAPLRPEDIKVREAEGGRSVPYIDARVVINRLNTVCPGEWEDGYDKLSENDRGDWSVKCALTIHGPQGPRTREGVGTGENKTSKSGSSVFDGPDKAGESDSRKRAAVKFGIGMELYNDPQGSIQKANGRPARQNGDSQKRPAPEDAVLPAETFKVGFQQRTGKSPANGQPISDSQKTYVASLMSAAYKAHATKDQDRYIVLSWLTDRPIKSTGDLNAAEASALIDRLTDETGDLGQRGFTELQNCYRAAMQGQGQTDMFEEPEAA